VASQLNKPLEDAGCWVVPESLGDSEPPRVTPYQPDEPYPFVVRLDADLKVIGTGFGHALRMPQSRRRDRRIGCGGRPRASTRTSSRGGDSGGDPDEPSDLGHRRRHPRSTRRGVALLAAQHDSERPRRRRLEHRFEERLWAWERARELDLLRQELDEQDERDRRPPEGKAS
jgi:hypothetical protein